MTPHHTIAIVLAVQVVCVCLLVSSCSVEKFDKVMTFAQSIVIATFAHAGAGALARAATRKAHDGAADVGKQ